MKRKKQKPGGRLWHVPRGVHCEARQRDGDWRSHVTTRNNVFPRLTSKNHNDDGETVLLFTAGEYELKVNRNDARYL